MGLKTRTQQIFKDMADRDLARRAATELGKPKVERYDDSRYIGYVRDDYASYNDTLAMRQHMTNYNTNTTGTSTANPWQQEYYVGKSADWAVSKLSQDID